MFNFKKIGIALSIMGLIALTGALMAGPAFASKKDKDLGGAEDGATHKMDICHFNADGDWVDDGTNTNTLELVDVDVWMFQTVDDMSGPKHIAKHNEDNGDGTFTFDFEILSDDAGVTLAACDALVGRA